MKAPRRLIPTERFWFSVGAGALASLSMLLVACALPKAVFLAAVVLSPFVCGFAAGIVFGTGAAGGRVYSVLCGIAGYPVFYVALFPLAYIPGKWGEPISILIYVSLVYFILTPFLLLVPFFVSVAGAFAGRPVARALER
jgi:hypothetical protein